MNAWIERSVTLSVKDGKNTLTSHIEKTWLFHPCCKAVTTLLVGVVTTLSPAGMRLETPLDLTL